jgi:protein KRI1
MKVNRDEYDLTDEMLLLLDDKTINKYIPLKKLAPYRENKKQLNDYQKKNIFKNLQKELERKKRELNARSEREEEVVQENKKMLTKKRKTDTGDGGKKEFLSMDEYKKKKRLETYGL